MKRYDRLCFDRSMVNNLLIFARRHQVFPKYYLRREVAKTDYTLGLDQLDMMQKPCFQRHPMPIVNSTVDRKRLNNGR